VSIELPLRLFGCMNVLLISDPDMVMTTLTALFCFMGQHDIFF